MSSMMGLCLVFVCIPFPIYPPPPPPGPFGGKGGGGPHGAGAPGPLAGGPGPRKDCICNLWPTKIAFAIFVGMFKNSRVLTTFFQRLHAIFDAQRLQMQSLRTTIIAIAIIIFTIIATGYSMPTSGTVDTVGTRQWDSQTRPCIYDHMYIYIYTWLGYRHMCAERERW